MSLHSWSLCVLLYPSVDMYMLHWSAFVNVCAFSRVCVHEYLFITGRSLCVDCVCVGKAIDVSTSFKGCVED